MHYLKEDSKKVRYKGLANTTRGGEDKKLILKITLL